MGTGHSPFQVLWQREQKTSVEEVAEESSENSSPKTARKLRRERTPTSNDRLNPFLMSLVWEKEDIQYDMNQTLSHENLQAMEERFISPYKRLGRMTKWLRILNQ